MSELISKNFHIIYIYYSYIRYLQLVRGRAAYMSVIMSQPINQSSTKVSLITSFNNSNAVC